MTDGLTVNKRPRPAGIKAVGAISTEAARARVPPHDLEAERSVLGAVLIDNDALARVLEFLQTDDFYREAHRRIFAGMIALFERNEPCDIVTLHDQLAKQSALEATGGPTYLAELSLSVPTAANVHYYAKIVRERSMARRLISTATDIATCGYEGSTEVSVLLDEAESKIFEISESRVKQTYAELKQVIKQTFKTIEMLYERKELVTGVPSGFHDLDRMTSGLQKSELVVLAARPSMGKTALALNIAAHAAIHAKIPTAVFSLEMSKEQLALRLLCSEAKVDMSRLRGGFLGELDWPKLTRAAGALSQAPIFIDDSAAITVLEMRAKARRLARDKGLGLIIVDYLQLARGSGYSQSREQEISEISRGLKALAKELNIPVVALSQLNRSLEQRPNKRPQLSDLRESGAIEQDADLILFIYRDEVYNKDSEKKGIAELIVGKQRNGPIGSVDAAFISNYTRFENLDKAHG